jgi:hypothetical protein
MTNQDTQPRHFKNYSDDVNIAFQEEMVHFKYFASQLEDSDDTIPASQSYELTSDNMVQSTFPNVLTAPRIYRCLMITNATGERTFYRLKILKNCHKASKKQKCCDLLIRTSLRDWLTSLAERCYDL